MTLRAWAVALLLPAAACAGDGRDRSSASGGGPVDAALVEFQNGEFEKADATLRAAAGPEAVLARAGLLLLRNRNRQAAELLAPLVRREPANAEEYQNALQAYHYLALAYPRLDDYFNAARVARIRGESIAAAKYQSLVTKVGYLTDAGWGEARVPFEAVDPLPLVRMEVNGRSGLFILDTGLDELVLDRRFASAARVRGFGLRTDQYSRSFDEAVVAEVRLGALRVRHVPAHVGGLTPIAAVRADGAIGLGFLMHFEFTLDFGRGRLLLRPPGGPPGGTPALIGGDRSLLLPGTVNGSLRTFAAVHTGLAGVAVAAPETLLAPDELKELRFSGLVLPSPKLDHRAFPIGLGSSFGVPVGFALGPKALAGRSIRVEPRSMTIDLR